MDAVCWNCGESKDDPRDQCARCGLTPQGPDDAVISAALCRSFLAVEPLQMFQREIRRAGRLPVDRQAIQAISKIISDNDGRDMSGRIFDAIIECFTVDRMRGMSDNEKAFRSGDVHLDRARVIAKQITQDRNANEQGGAVGCYSILGITSIFCVIAALSINHDGSRWIMGLLALIFFLAGFAVFRMSGNK